MKLTSPICLNYVDELEKTHMLLPRRTVGSSTPVSSMSSMDFLSHASVQSSIALKSPKYRALGKFHTSQIANSVESCWLS